MADNILTIDFGVTAPAIPRHWYFMVVPLENLAERSHMWLTKQYAATSHEHAIQQWKEDAAAQEFMRPFLAARGLKVDGYFVQRWTEECLNAVFLPTLMNWRERQRAREEAKWAEPRWFDAERKEVAR